MKGNRLGKGITGLLLILLLALVSLGAMAEMEITLEKTEVLTHNQTEMTVNASGAAWIEVFAYDEEENEAGHWWNEGGEAFDQPVGGWDRAETITLHVIAHFEPENGDEYTEEADREVKVTAPNGTLSAPVIDNVTATLTVGNSLEVSFTADGAEWVHTSLQFSENREWIADQDAEYSPESGKWTVSYDASCFENTQGTPYVLGLHANKEGYNSGHTEMRFVVLPREKSTAITLTVDDETPKELQLQSSQNVTVHVDAPNATAVRVLNGDWWDYWWGEDDYTWDWGFGSGNYVLVAQATYDAIDFDALDASGWEDFDWNNDVAWSGLSNSVTLRVTSQGSLRAPNFTLEKEKVEYGEFLVINITDETAFTEDGKALDGDYWYYVNVEELCSDEEGNSWWQDMDLRTNIWVDGSEKTLRVPTFLIQRDEETRYIVRVGVDTMGWDGNESRKSFFVGPANFEEATLSFTSDKTQIVTTEQTRLVAYQSGAEWYDVQVTKEGDYGWSQRMDDGGEIFAQDWAVGEAGVYTLTAYANGMLRDEEGNERPDEDGNDTWRNEIGSVTITVTAESDLATPRLKNIPAVITQGQTISPAFDRIDGADEYYVWLRYAPDDGDWDELINETIPQFDGSETSLEVSAGLLEKHGLGRYQLSMYASGANRNGSYAEQYFCVVEEISKDISIQINGSSKDVTNYPAGTNYQVQITAPGATAVRLMREGGWDPMDGRGADENGVFTYEYSMNSGTYAFAAQASYDKNEDGTDINWDEFDWNDFDFNRGLNWTATSGSISITIVAKGQLEAPAFTLNTNAKGEIAQGTDLIATITNVQEGCGYNAGLERLNEDEDGNRWTDWIDFYDWDSKGAVRILTYDLEPGATYVVTVNVGTEGYDGNAASQTFTVTENENLKAEFRAGSLKATTCEDIELIAFYPNADGISVYISRQDDENWNDYRGNDGGQVLRDMWMSGHDGTYVLRAVANWTDRDENGNPIYGENGEPLHFEEIGTLEITVTADGVIDINRPEDLPSYVTFGQSLEFNMKMPDGADWYDVNVWWDDENGGLYYEENIREDREVATGGIPDFETWMHVGVYAAGYGLNDNYVVWDLPIVPAISAEDLKGAFSMKLPAALLQVDEEAFAGVNLDAVILAEDVGEEPSNLLGFLSDAGTRFLIIPDGATPENYRFGPFLVMKQSEYNEIVK